MERETPAVVVLGGPNGAGKSTLAGELLAGVLRVSEFVDADVLARQLPRSDAAAVTAGRAVLRRLDELAGARKSFAFETTLASRSLGVRIQRLITTGYECHLAFLRLASADQAVARVVARVRLGGHAVPEDTVRRRYRSRMYDNSAETPRLVASGAGAATLSVEDPETWQRIRAEAGHEG